MKIQTKVSQAFWCQLLVENSGLKAEFQKARLHVGPCRNERCVECGKCEEVAWFDKLFKDGIEIPDEDSNPLVFLVTGPPGSGKSSLCIELCYRLAQNNDMISLYISAESGSNDIIKKGISFGYPDAKTKMVSYTKDFDFKTPEGKVFIWGKDKIDSYKKASDIFRTAMSDLNEVFEKVPQNVIEALFNKLRTASIVKDTKKLSPQILVFDSLNLLEKENVSSVLDSIMEATRGKGKLVFLILDSGIADRYHDHWEYASDVVIRLDHGSDEKFNDYYIRTIEVTKARNQEHIWGKHQLKIYPQYNYPSDQHASENLERMRRDHPYRNEGGIFIYPSIHYYLSEYKRLSSPAKFNRSETLPGSLSETLNHGYPQGRCTAFIGRRGGHKSHLAYLHLLYRMINFEESALVISLRDDEGMTENTMNTIIKENFPQNSLQLRELEMKNRLEILYFHPGYITPEEFFHRVYMSVHRLKKHAKHLNVMFNSLDQLAARFPLCAKQQIFVPGLINFFSGEQITSIFIAVEEEGQPKEQYGLLPMADLILSFGMERVRYQNYRTLVSKLSEEARGHRYEEVTKGPKVDSELRSAVILQVERFAGGQRAGARGILELVEDFNKQDLYASNGLHFIPIPEEESERILIK